MTALKYSRQREAILQNLHCRSDHPTADMIYEDIRSAYPNLSLGTVYRNLTLLCGMGAIRRLSTESGADRFDARTDDHDHLVCRLCGKVTDIPAGNCAALLRHAQQSFDGQIESCRILYRGLCKDCAGHEKRL